MLYVLGDLHAQAPSKNWIQSPDGCLVYYPNPQKNETITWTGQCKDGRSHGEGKLTRYTKGEIFETYTGRMHNGRKEGPGTTKYGNGVVQTGNYVYGLLEGKAEVFEFGPHGDTLFHFKGNFEAGIAKGKGWSRYAYSPTFIEINEGHFEGYSLKGEGSLSLYSRGKLSIYRKGGFPWEDFNGTGESIELNQHYIGQFYEGNRNGSGKVLFKDKVIYEGEWKINQMHGIGLRVFPNGSRYYGNFKNNDINGFGVLAWSEHHYYIGEFKKGLLHGTGFTIAKGKLDKQGTWQKGRLINEDSKGKTRDRISKKYGAQVETFLTNALKGYN